ncbi:MAG: hypothetical protein EHM58_05405 [Ignavibacteriae bacterium]|nr:MAG: hypothetical protein EHM58_05405 [Ignavibacteriota bacterium]
MIRTIFQWCVDILNFLAGIFGTDYYTINIIIFCVVGPLVFIYMAYIIYKQRKLIHSHKLVSKTGIIGFLVIIVVISAAIIIIAKPPGKDIVFDKYIYQYSDSKDFTVCVSSDTIYIDSYIDLEQLEKNSRLYKPANITYSYSRLVCFLNREQTYISATEQIY